MAQVDVSELLTDPDFVDEVTLIRRESTVGTDGEHEVSAGEESTIYASVQDVEGEDLARLPEGTRLHDALTVYFGGKLYPAGDGTFGDLIVWNGRRYLVHQIAEDFTNWGGGGYVKALCIAENLHA